MFPEHVTQKLKHGEAVISEAHDCVTVLFSDIVGYTSMSTSVNTADVFDMLNKLYTAFDALSDKHGVYKVDTIGDGKACLSASGYSNSLIEFESSSNYIFYLQCLCDFVLSAYMVAAGHEESSKQDHHLRVFAMAKVSVRDAARYARPGTAQCETARCERILSKEANARAHRAVQRISVVECAKRAFSCSFPKDRHRMFPFWCFSLNSLAPLPTF